MKAAIIGAGMIAQAHAEALRSNAIELEAVITSRKESARAFAERWNIPFHSDDLSLIHQLSIDSVHVCTPPLLHASSIRELLQHKKHVLCEKPLSTDVEEARELAMLANTSQQTTALGLNVRYAPTIDRMRSILHSEEFGDVVLIHGSYLQQFGLLPTQYSWRFNETFAGKTRATTEIGTHWLDLVQYLTGMRITRVSALFNTPSPIRYELGSLLHKEPPSHHAKRVQVTSEDVALVHFQLENHSFGSLVLSQVSAGRVNHLNVEISGEHQSLWWNSENYTQFNWGDREQGIHRELFPFGNNGFNDSVRHLVRDFYQTIENGGNGRPEKLPDFDDGLRLAILCEAIYQSAQQEGAWINVEEPSLSNGTQS